jgi:hypothetical protein
VELSLELTQVEKGAPRQGPRDLSAVLFVNPMQPDQRIENEQARLACLDGVAEPFPFVGASKWSVGAVISSTGRDSENRFIFPQFSSAVTTAQVS